MPRMCCDIFDFFSVLVVKKRVIKSCTVMADDKKVRDYDAKKAAVNVRSRKRACEGGADYEC